MRAVRFASYFFPLKNRWVSARNIAEVSTELEHKNPTPKRQARVHKVEPQSHVYATSDFHDHRAMQLVFLGTSSSVPTCNRNNSCIALRLVGTVYLFDCGEGAQKQIIKTPFQQRGVDKIFITHMHGDHIFGLPGVLIGLTLCPSKGKDPIEIYGPQGLRNWLRVTLNASYVRVPTKYVVHELILKKDSSTKFSLESHKKEVLHEDELQGRDIYQSKDGLWDLFSDGNYRVQAAYTYWKLNRFMVEHAERLGVEPGEKRALLQQGQSVFVDGKQIKPSDVLGPPRRGRKVVILGDTYNPSSLQTAAFGADALVHECTLLEEDGREAFKKAHSTATMAGKFARIINAESLILTHFGGKFTTANCINNSVNAARKAFGKTNVLAASDLLAVTIRFPDDDHV
ncbi:hypothetical protein SUGI_0470820 [Cryptomeria japonica]|nr:hypothetical protein SUGI_0470820 [Cryptomeria japonica]